MIGVVKAGVTGKTHDVMVAKAVFWRLGGMGGFAGPVLCWRLWLSDLEPWDFAALGRWHHIAFGYNFLPWADWCIV